MNPIIYNACMLLGLLLVGVGVFLMLGLGTALAAVGIMLIVLTAFAALFAGGG